jgi:hypothetical protein
MTLFFASCSCQPWKRAGKHMPGCPMDSNCSFCEKSPQICKLMGECTGIRKKHRNFKKIKKARDDSKMRLSNKFNDLIHQINCLINQDAISETLQEKIDALKAAFNALVSKKRLLPTELEEAEKILFQLRRVYVTQKAAHDKNLKEKEAAALAKCAADDFVPTRSD